jgi:predicted Zn-dependent protease
MYLVLCLGAACLLSAACSTPATSNATASAGAKTANTAASSTPAAAAATPVAATTPAAGKAYTHASGGISFEVPAGWKEQQDGDQLTLSAPDDTISVVVWVTEEADFDASTKALGEELGKTFKNLKMDGEPKEDTYNGMAHASTGGSGQIEGQDMVFSADLLQAKKPVIVLTFASPDNFKKHQADYERFTKSIKKVA